MTRKKTSGPAFEKSLNELEKLVEKMEHGELSLEASLAHFETGVQLSRACQQALAAAEQKVEILMQQDGHDSLEPFDSEES